MENKKWVKILALILVIWGNGMVFLTLWLTRKYDRITFDQVIFQIKTSAAGANHSLMGSAYMQVGVFTAIAVIAEYYAYRFLSGDLPSWEHRWRNTQSYLRHYSGKFATFLRKQLLPIALIISIIGTSIVSVRLNVPDYLNTSHTNSNFYYMHYVNPKTADIRFPEKKRNLIYIFLESMEATYGDTNAGGPITDNFIPELTQLAEENVSFSNRDGLGGAHSYDGTTWTAASMVAQTSGITVKVPLTAENYGGENEFLPGVVSIGELLEDEGYNQTLLIGSDSDFAGRETYFTEHGDYYIKDIKEIKRLGILPEDYRVWWGFEDEKLFEYAKVEAQRLYSEGKPFNLTMLTADTHFPDGYVCELCEDKYDQQYANVLACSSRQVYQFVRWVQEQPFYENTTIVLCGDHLTMDQDFLSDIDPDYERTVYNCIINPAVEPERGEVRQFGVFDMMPTTLAAMGCTIKGNQLGLGVNLFSKTKTLTERFGYKALNEELLKRSDYYNEKFLQQ